MYRRRRALLPTRSSRASHLLIGGFGVGAVDQTSYSFANLAIAHAPNVHRVVYAWVPSSANGTIQSEAEPISCTIGDVAPALVTRFTRSVANSHCVSLFAARLPAGSNATVNLTFSVAARRCGCILASIISPKLFPPLFGTLAAAGTADIASPVLVPRTGFAAAYTQSNTATINPLTLSGNGVLEVVDANVEGGTQMGAALLSTSDILNITCANDAGMDAIWMAF